MNPEEVFALLRRADPAPDAPREEFSVTDIDKSRRRAPAWVRPAGIAAAAALAVVVAIGPLGLLGGSDSDVIAPTTTLPTPTTDPSGETTETTSTTTVETTSPEAGVGGLVVSNGSTVTWVGPDGDGSVTPGVDIPAKVVYDDLAGGIVYQLWLPYVGDTGDSTVYHLPAGATEPRVLRSPSGAAWEWLMAVTSVDGSPTALVVERRDPVSFEDATDTLFEIDLATGESSEVAVVGGWESGLESVSWDGSAYVASTFAEAYTFLDTIDRDGTFTEWEGALPPECFDDPTCPRRVVASPDGERLVMIRSGNLVEWDRSDDREVQEIELPEGIWLAPILSGDTVVLNQYSDGFNGDHGVALVVDLADGTVGEAPYAGFADWIDGPQLVVGPVDPSQAVDSVPALLLDGVVQDGAEACSGADGAIVFVLQDGSRAMVGFEEGTFLRFIDIDGTVYETADVSADESLPPSWSGIISVGGLERAITIIGTSGVSLPDCTGAFRPTESRVFGYVTAIEEVDGSRFVVFDEFNMLTGVEAETAAAAAAAAAAAGGTEVANDYFMTEGPQGVSIQLLPEATVTVVGEPCCESVEADLEQWVELQPGDLQAWIDAGWMTNALPYWFTVEGGAITAIEQQYLP
jgi:hypothetical protein